MPCLYGAQTFKGSPDLTSESSLKTQIEELREKGFVVIRSW